MFVSLFVSIKRSYGSIPIFYGNSHDPWKAPSMKNYEPKPDPVNYEPNPDLVNYELNSDLVNY